ncbi:endonuclease/exonuclease/phosphatase family protein [Acuticoccus sp. I52.16.1]|uniref:endonuclease/exonuclease/phosphatase family protein n=1 Tax=Acuticoccus sp. I52.16.1 TaxID=2928472 RepID=UPI001FD186A5|nr:endonuclease/exonuclease/phosphatase family protein [Acuticoccus sp. I52.16.1]UOM36396.1 endonuclease/exonuclease/phosphatase family protein [Acuticoccus sp. I52.16.1]
MTVLATLWRWGWSLIVLVGGLAIILGYFGSQHPALDSLAHFRAHLVVLVGVAALVRLVSGRGAGRWLALVVLGLCIYSGAGAAHYMLPDTSIRLTAGKTYTLLQFNAAQNWQRASTLLTDLKPDFAALQETPMPQGRRLVELMEVYPHVATCSGRSRWADTVLLSKYPFSGEPICGNSSAFVRATVILENKALTLASHHLSWPWPYGQSEDISLNVGSLRAITGSRIIAGDFNAAPWSLAVRRTASLTQTVPTTGIGPTWLLRGVELAYRPYVGLPIDNILTAGVAIAQVQRLDDAGSDHLPVLMRFAFEDY